MTTGSRSACRFSRRTLQVAGFGSLTIAQPGSVDFSSAVHSGVLHGPNDYSLSFQRDTLNVWTGSGRRTLTPERANSGFYGSVVTTIYSVGTADGMNEKGLAAYLPFLEQITLLEQQGFSVPNDRPPLGGNVSPTARFQRAASFT